MQGLEEALHPQGPRALARPFGDSAGPRETEGPVDIPVGREKPRGPPGNQGKPRETKGNEKETNGSWS